MTMQAEFLIGEYYLSELVAKVNLLEHKYRPDFVLTFSASHREAIWPFATWGYTKQNQREPIDDPLLKRVVDELEVVRPELGRFHIDIYGAYWGDQKAPKNQFIKFGKLLGKPNDFEVVRSLCQTQPSNAEILHRILAKKREQC
jgi:hypothetical protein